MEQEKTTSFSALVKAELCRAPLNRRCCAQAEAYGVLLYCNTFRGDEIKIMTESEPFAQRLPALFKKAFKVTFDRLPDGAGKYIFTIRDPKKLAAILQVYGGAATDVALHINFAVVEEDCCRASFFRGAFLAGGSVTDPRKGYHLELATSHRGVSREVPVLLGEMDFHPKNAQRKGNAVTYFKQSVHIEDFLITIGAPLTAMEVMNAKLEKSLRGGREPPGELRRRQPGQGGGGGPESAGGHPAIAGGRPAEQPAGQAEAGGSAPTGESRGHAVPAGGAV